jgi:hypothetical protein
LKNALIVVVLVAAAIYFASWFWAGDEVNAAAARPWPAGLGTLDAVPGRYPPQLENEAARKLSALAVRVSDDDAITTYVRREIASGEVAVAVPPPIVDVSAIRNLLLSERIVWKRDLMQQHGGLLPKVSMHQSLMRTLVASALGRARKREPGAWDDLHAAWNLTKALDEHPNVILRTVAMSMTRAINAVAWRMPPPAPAWFDEVRNHDYVRPRMETLQYENWRRTKDQKFPLKSLAETIDRDRKVADAFAGATACEVRGTADIGWQRAFRYRAEREATANALHARAGQPIEERSQCSDGGWSFDGKMLRFTRPIVLPEQHDTSMPLALHLRE